MRHICEEQKTKFTTGFQKCFTTRSTDILFPAQSAYNRYEVTSIVTLALAKCGIFLSHPNPPAPFRCEAA